MPSVFLLNAIVLFSGVVAFLVAGFAGTFMRSLQPWRYRLLLAPLGFVVSGGICISAEQHLLRWIQHGHLHHSFSSGVVQSIMLLIGGLCGLLTGLGLGTSLDTSLSKPVDHNNLPVLAPQPTKARSRKAIVVPISKGRQAGVVPHIKASSDHE